MWSLLSLVSSPFGEVHFSPEQVFYISVAKWTFIAGLIVPFPLYYMSPFKYWCGGDGQDAKFPCSISWMTRKGLPRYFGNATWLTGWAFLLYSMTLHQQRNAIGIQIWVMTMFIAGFVTVILTPIREDVAMGHDDTIHCVGASIYIADHFLANKWVFGVDCFSANNMLGLGFTLNFFLCSVCQGLRMNDNRAARSLYDCLLRFSLMPIKYHSFILCIEVLFQFSENTLLLCFLLGFTSGRAAIAEL